MESTPPLRRLLAAPTTEMVKSAQQEAQTACMRWLKGKSFSFKIIDIFTLILFICFIVQWIQALLALRAEQANRATDATTFGVQLNAAHELEGSLRRELIRATDILKKELDAKKQETDLLMASNSKLQEELIASQRVVFGLEYDYNSISTDFDNESAKWKAALEVLRDQLAKKEEEVKEVERLLDGRRAISDDQEKVSYIFIYKMSIQ